MPSPFLTVPQPCALTGLIVRSCRCQCGGGHSPECFAAGCFQQLSIDHGAALFISFV